MGKSIKGVAALAAVVAIAAVGATSAPATTGQVTRALATPDWGQASIAGAVAWTGCELKAPEEKPPKEPRYPEYEIEDLPPVGEPPPRCGWIPFVTVGPGTQGSECSSPGRQRPEALGSAVTLAWKESERGSQGTATFDVSGVPLDGRTGQLVCLSLLERASAFRWDAERSIPLASALLTAEPQAGKPCACPGSSHRHRKHRHHRHRRHHHGISLSQRIAVSKK